MRLLACIQQGIAQPNSLHFAVAIYEVSVIVIVIKPSMF